LKKTIDESTNKIYSFRKFGMKDFDKSGLPSISQYKQGVYIFFVFLLTNLG